VGEIKTLAFMIALVLGSTGLIGEQLIQRLLQDNTYSRVKALSRHPLNVNHPKLQVILVDFENLDHYKVQLNADVIFCCLGTTMKQAGSKEAFKKVDYDYPLKTAQLGKAQGATRYLLISALGASKNSAIYYNQIKGEIEGVIEAIGFESFHILRPSLLLGHRKEPRVGEGAAKMVYKIFGFLIPQKYQAIDSSKVANAMLFYGKQHEKGTFVHESRELQNF
jgi:uncharacterized protein YbjT (DUF2867 family)